MFKRKRSADDFAEEINAHIEIEADELKCEGLSEEEAHRKARVEFGSVCAAQERYHLKDRIVWFDNLLRDLRFTIRQLSKHPGFTATVVGTLALGIAAAAAMFTVVDHVLLRPLPFKNSGRLVVIQEGGGRNRRYSGAPWLDVEQWIAQSRSFDQIAVYGWGWMGGRNFLITKSASLQIEGEAVSPNLFATLGVSPLLGRGFLPGTVGYTAGKNAGTIVLSHALWKDAFGGDPAIIGKSVKINRDSYTVVGVMPPGFEFPLDASSPLVWLPMVLGDRDKTRDYMTPNYFVIGRLRNGVSIETADAEMQTIQRRISASYTDAELRKAHSGARVLKFGDTLVAADLKKALLALLAASGILWLIASVNVTNLMLARGAARQREIAMRGALGASRWRVMQQFLVEGLVLSAAATVLGTALALAAVRLSRSAKPVHLDVDLSIHLNFVILAVLCGLTLLTAVVSSVWPAFLAVRAPIEPALKQGGAQAGIGRHSNRARAVLVAAEVAMSLTLIVACGLLLRTIYTLRHVPLGFRTDHIVVASLAIPSYRYAGENMIANLYQPLLERVQKLHGVQAAGYMSEVPLGQSFNIELTLVNSGKRIGAMLKPVSPSIQRIFGFKMLAGRFFNEQDTATSQPVVVVNRAFARLFSPDKHDPTAVVGQQFMNLRKNAKATVIGVLDDERQASITEPSQPEVEVCLPQVTPASGFYHVSTISMDLVVRTDRAPDSIIPDLRDLLRQASPEMANATFTTMDQVVEDSFGSQRLAAHLLEVFGASALLLSVAGLYGLLAWVVTQRTREMGIRIALGAARGNLLWLILRQAGAMLLAGIAGGTGLALLCGRLLRGYLYGVSTHDAWTLAGAAALLFLTGLLAAYLPAHRAASADPMVALRAE